MKNQPEEHTVISESVKDAEYFIEIEKRMTEQKLDAISSQMDCVHAAIADIQTKFNDYYNSMYAKSEQAYYDVENSVSLSQTDQQSLFHAAGVNDAQQPTTSQTSVTLDPLLSVNTTQQIDENNHEIDTMIKSVNNSLVNIEKFLADKKFTTAFTKELESAMNIFNDSIESIQPKFQTEQIDKPVD